MKTKESDIDIYFESIFASLSRILIGGLAAIIIGVLMALLRFSLPPRMQHGILPGIIFDLPKFPPPIAWIPFVILFFGIGEFSAWTIVLIGAMPPIMNSTYDGLRRIPLPLIQFSRSLELNRRQMISKVHLPYILPEFLTGLRSGMGMGWMSIVAAEMISSNSGLGYLIQLHRIDLDYSLMLIDISFIALVGFLIMEGLRWLEGRLSPWQIHEGTK